MVGDKSIKIAFISNESFPTGMSTTNRILSLAKGLTNNNSLTVDIYCVRPTESTKNTINHNTKGNISEAISFQYTTRSIIWPESLFGKIWVTLLGIFNFLIIFLKTKNKDHYDVLINTTTDIIPSLLYQQICKLKNIKYLLTIDEYPRVVRTSENYSKLFKFIYLKFFYRMYDGLIIMTNPLIGYFNEKMIRYDCKVIHIPMTVEPERFNISINSHKKHKYIAYCGNLGQNQKDGVPLLIKAFAEINKRFPEFYLFIIGDAISSQKEQVYDLMKLTQDLNIGSNVIFTGKVHRDKMPEYLCNADILALARPNNIQAQGGFPTKLGEYLATGKPVVVTKVGEIPAYLSHNQNVFFSEPDSVSSFTEQLEFVIENYEFAKKVGLAGKQIANTIFNYTYQGEKLGKYIEQLIKN